MQDSFLEERERGLIRRFGAALTAGWEPEKEPEKESQTESTKESETESTKESETESKWALKSSLAGYARV